MLLLATTTALRNGATDSTSVEEADDPTKQDFSGEAATLFGGIRIPAALFAGASAGAAFAMPISATASEGLKVGLVKRIYALLMMATLTSQIIAIVVGTVASSALANKCPFVKTASVSEFLNANYPLEWAACRFHFLSGVLLFVLGVGMRAWITVACPVFAKASLGAVITTSLLCVAFVQDLYERIDGFTGCGQVDSFYNLPIRYLRLLAQKALKKPMFAAAFVSMLATYGYLFFQAPHVIRYLTS
ncbi:expressed unknown protein [Seminavis robusta]|uniref:Uncharacterized protein n=1 Tax=Seminavis robusta TaxID=568900 RepID=A0A9N8H4J1_9STRA|nr:expressed unknown protein [Seminavis robusta]|eukprot:Sro9_g007340.1 n/a (246) ;mRNA; r:120200-120937